MKYIVILGDGMADNPVEALNGATPLQKASVPAFDFLARNGNSGLLKTIPEGYPAGSEVGNLSILGYDVKDSFEGRGPLEAASLGYEMETDDLAMRCNLIAVDEDGVILNHHGNAVTSEEAAELINFLNQELGIENIKLIPGFQYRHLLILKKGKKGMTLFPPHDHVGENIEDLLSKTLKSAEGTDASDSAEVLVDFIRKSRHLLENHPINLKRKAQGKGAANLVWLWGEGYRPKMQPLTSKFPGIKGGVMITAVDLLRGIGHYAGLKPIYVEGATGLEDTNYEGKAQAAIDALKDNDFVFIHVEATDEASHDRDLDLKLKTIEFLDNRIVKTIVEETDKMDEPVRIALLPDHPTSVETGKHCDSPVPFVIYQKGIKPDNVKTFDEISCAQGSFGLLNPTDFIKLFLEL